MWAVVLVVLGLFACDQVRGGVVRVDSDMLACHDSSKLIHPSQLHDGICDCEDGSDESEGTCQTLRFVCGERANFKTILKSRVHDGQCDCCDGSDEMPSHCTDTCSQKAAVGDTFSSKAQVVFDDDDNNTNNDDDIPDMEDLIKSSGGLDIVPEFDVPSQAIEPASGVSQPTEADHSEGAVGVVPDQIVDALEQKQRGIQQNTIVGGELLEDILRQNEINSVPDDHEHFDLEYSGKAYYRDPVIAGDNILFISEDDLWSVPKRGGVATLLTTSTAQVFRARVSPCGQWVAYSASDEGSPEIFVMPINGGQAKRITFVGGAMVVTWTPDGKHVVFMTTSSHIHGGSQQELFRVPVLGGQSEPIGVGWATYMSYGYPHCEMCECSHKHNQSSVTCHQHCSLHGPHNCVFNKQSGHLQGKQMTFPSALGRFTSDVSFWKRYQGGMRGKMWLDVHGTGSFSRIHPVSGNVGMFAWTRHGVVFVSDSHCKQPQTHKHDCVANLFLAPHGHNEHSENQVKQLTHFTTYYVRSPTVAWGESETTTLTFTWAQDIYTMTLDENGEPSKPQVLDVLYNSPRQQEKRKFFSPNRITEFSVSPDGMLVAYLARGRIFVDPVRQRESVLQYGQRSGIRYSKIEFMSTGDLVAASDEAESSIEIFRTSGPFQGKSEIVVGGTAGQSFGRIDELSASPNRQMIAFVNHRFQLIVFDIQTRAVVCTTQSLFHPGLRDISWSPDGRWIAYTTAVGEGLMVVNLIRVVAGETFNADFDVCGTVEVTPRMRRDYSPSWDPDGKYLFLISSRNNAPRSDEIVPTEMFFVGTEQPFLILLNGADKGPFYTNQETEEGLQVHIHHMLVSKGHKMSPAEELLIDLGGIRNRLIEFPVPPGSYGFIVGLPASRVFFQRQALDSGKPMLMEFDLITHSTTMIATGVSAVTVPSMGKFVAVAGRFGVCVFSSSLRGKLHPQLIKCTKTEAAAFEVDPKQDWAQIFLETWRRARDNFWTRSMKDIDWEYVRERYMPLLARVGTRSELSDLIMQLQGELATSHAFHKLARHRHGETVRIGRLGCDVSWDEAHSGYRVDVLHIGDPWDPESAGPLVGPGINVVEGDVILSVNGKPTSSATPLAEMLLDKTEVEVELQVLKFLRKKLEDGDYVRKPLHTFTVSVTPLVDDKHLRYRDWTNNNREVVGGKSQGRIGYMHIPSMSATGWAEFHRAFLTQTAKAGLIVDLRFNTGGFISQGLSDKLSRKPMGFMVSRWGSAVPYPSLSSNGPKVFLINEACASDCEIFANTVCSRVAYRAPCFHDGIDMDRMCIRLGEQTWGGVIGINWKGVMMDSSKTSQPEFAYWFMGEKGRGWSVENSGVQPDVRVSYEPEHFQKMYQQGAFDDPQLDAAIKHILGILDDETYQKQQKVCLEDMLNAPGMKAYLA